MVIPYGKGRVFHTALGHGVETLQGVGFQVTLQRGTEWAATGNVTQASPKADDLGPDKVVTRDPMGK
jgi:type 1 glutamine amidotransferase